MIVKRHFTPASMWPYVRLELALAPAASSVTAWLLVDRAGWTQWTLPVVVATVLSILLAVRVNTSYQRWWEGSAIWAQVLGLSRNVVRVAVSVSNSKPHTDPELVHRVPTRHRPPADRLCCRAPGRTARPRRCRPHHPAGPSRPARA